MTGWTSPTHIVALLLIALLVFGGKRLPEIGRTLGSGMREFKDSVSGPSGAETQESPNGEKKLPTVPTPTPPTDRVSR